MIKNDKKLFFIVTAIVTITVLGGGVAPNYFHKRKVLSLQNLVEQYNNSTVPAVKNALAQGIMSRVGKSAVSFNNSSAAADLGYCLQTYREVEFAEAYYRERWAQQYRAMLIAWGRSQGCW